MRMIFLLGLACSVGTALRFLLKQLFHSFTFPLGTLLVNLLGSFCLGFLYTYTQGGQGASYAILGVGFLGGFTTFSTMNVEFFELVTRNKRLFFLYLGTSYGFGLILAMCGIFFGNFLRR